MQMNPELLCMTVDEGDTIYRRQLAVERRSNGNLHLVDEGQYAFTADASRMMIVRSASIELWDLETGELLRTLPYGRRWLFSGEPHFTVNASAYDVSNVRLVVIIIRPRPRYPGVPAVGEHGCVLRRLNLPEGKESTQPLWLRRPSH